MMEDLFTAKLKSSVATVVVVLLAMSCCVRAEANEYCLRDVFNASCPNGQVVMMSSARYGRMRARKCINYIEQSMGCAADVISFLDPKCSGRQRCDFKVTDLVDLTQPCEVDYSSYLEANYTCVEVASAEPSACVKHRAVPLTDQKGYLTYEINSKHGGGRRGCPFRITVDPNQRIRFTAYNFVDTSKTAASSTSGSLTCAEDVIFEDDGRRTSFRPCPRTHQRALMAYESKTNEVSVHFASHGSSTGEGVIMLHYQALGCPRLKVPEGGHVIQNGRDATVKCNSTQETWFLTCKGNEWLGNPENCTGAPHPSPTSLRDDSRFPVGILIAVLIGVILGVLIGSVLLGIVFLCYKKKRPVPQHPPGGAPGGEFSLEDSRGIYPSLLQTKPSGTPGTGDYCYGYGARLPQGQVPQYLKQHSCTDAGEVRDGGHLSNADKEHIYESANFGRLPAALRSEGMPPVYYELDQQDGGDQGRMQDLAKRGVAGGLGVLPQQYFKS